MPSTSNEKQAGAEQAAEGRAGAGQAGEHRPEGGSSLGSLLEAERLIRRAAECVGPAVVGLGRGWGRGSGVVVAPGRVLASAHAVREQEVTIAFHDGRRAEGAVVGSDPDLGVAVIEVDTGDIEPVAWVPDGDTAQIGTAVLALANPGGRGLRATLGFVASAGRAFRGPRGRRVAGAIEHTAALPRGSAGGPLLDSSLRLIGLNAVRVDAGLILAVPADRALAERVERLARGERVGPPRLGVALAPPRAARRLRRAVGLPERDGLLVRWVQDASPAGRAGIARGDLIVAAAGRSIGNLDDLHGALESQPAGSSLALGVVRGVEELELSVDLNGDEEESVA